MSSQLHVRLYRDSFNTPWGFRLQGGKDLAQPLSIQRVFSNSPAEGELQRGDLILAIGGRDANELTHKQALDLIKHGGGQIQLIIQRPAPGRVSSAITIKPQRPRAPSLQQPPTHHQPPMPAQGGYGFQPKKVNLTNLGGGGPDFGSDFTHTWRPSVTQPVHVHTGARGPPHNAEMLNRVQESLDNISLSPRTPDYGYQAPPFASPTSPGGGVGGGYIPTGVRLDMEREQEERRKQQQQQQQQQYQQQHAPQYQPQQQQHSPQYHYEAPAHQPGYVPTGLRIEQQQGEQEQEVPEVPVWQMRKAFMNEPARPAPAPVGKSSAPKVPRPKPGSGPFTFGVDYSKPAVKSSSVTWKPQPVQRPVNVAPAQPVQSAPPPWQQQQQQPQQHHYDDDQPQAPPAWRTSLKSTGVKPWDADVDYQYGQKQGPRSVPFTPKGVSAAPYTPGPSGGGSGGGEAQNGPKVVHLQYNSPMGLYSKENVQETFAGQTKAMAAQGLSPGGGVPAPQNPAKPGERDWTQSAVFRMIHEEEHRGSHQQQQRSAPPPPAPKPQAQPFQQSFNPMEDEFGTSDF